MSIHKRIDLVLTSASAVIFAAMIVYGSMPWVYLIGVIGCAVMLAKIIWRNA